MNLLPMAFASLAVLQVSAADTRFSPGYWEQGYATGNMSAVMINLTLKVDDLAKAESAVAKRLTKSGASLQSMNNNIGYFGGQQSPKRAVKNVSYTLESEPAERVARSLFDIGELQQYSTSQQAASAQLEEIRSKLKLVEEESAHHAEGLKEAPIAAYLLDQLRTRLTASRDSYEAGLKRATITVVLVEDKSVKP